MTANTSYVGRFAPTPSGPLHFGSIIAALASFLEAKRHQGQWLLRIDDLDLPRLKPGATDSITRTLENLCLEWDRHVYYQSSRLDIYNTVLTKLINSGQVYHCYCSRKLTRGIPYPGTCRNKATLENKHYSSRIITYDTSIEFNDVIQGKVRQNIQHHSGDFIVQRSDTVFAYNLATAIDDSSDGITDVIRGADLLDSTPKQIYLQTLLQIPSPNYGHLPVALDSSGNKISKSDGAIDALFDRKPHQVLIEALRFLGQDVDYSLEKSDPKTVITWSLENWDISRAPKVESIKIHDAL